jgi:hypothetical protein
MPAPITVTCDIVFLCSMVWIHICNITQYTAHRSGLVRLGLVRWSGGSGNVAYSGRDGGTLGATTANMSRNKALFIMRSDSVVVLKDGEAFTCTHTHRLVLYTS